jgi:two-component system nitrate/nitrite response regulator NarL
MAAQTIPYVPNRSLETHYRSDHPEAAIATVLVYNNALLRSGLQHILLETPFAVVVTASAAAPSRVYDAVSEPALVLIEASQNSGPVLEVVRQVRERSPRSRIVVLADWFELSFVRLAHEAGVNGFCLAASDPAVLIKSLELIMLGESVIPSVILRSLMNELSQNTDQPLQDHIVEEPTLADLTNRKLSAREAQILSCLSQGAPNKVIARKLDITEATIKAHVKAILRKIGAANRTQAAIWATKHLPTREGAVQHI